MNKMFNDQGKSKLLEDRGKLLGNRFDEASSSNTNNQSIDEIRAEQKRMLGGKTKNVFNLSF